MYNPENLAATFANTMEGAGYGISDQLFNALEAEFAEALEVDQEDGNFTSIETFLDSLEYSAGRTLRALNNQ